MSPFVGPTQREVLRALRSTATRGFPMTLGKYTPQAVIRDEGGRWVLRELVMNRAAADEAGKKALAEDGMWMPEMEFQFLEPGTVLAEGDTRDALADAIERRAWPYG